VQKQCAQLRRRLVSVIASRCKGGITPCQKIMHVRSHHNCANVGVMREGSTVTLHWTLIWRVLGSSTAAGSPGTLSDRTPCSQFAVIWSGLAPLGSWNERENDVYLWRGVGMGSVVSASQGDQYMPYARESAPSFTPTHVSHCEVLSLQWPTHQPTC
jgi:hypothetical protein